MKTTKLIIFFFTLTLLLFCFGLYRHTISKSQQVTFPEISTIKENFEEVYNSYKNNKVAEIIAVDMTIEQKVGQMFMVSVQGTDVNENTLVLLEKYNIGGIAFLGSNISNKEQLQNFTAEINENSNINPLLAVDQEGKAVYRISWDPTLSESGESFFRDMQLRSETLREAGINTNLGPVADIASTPDSFMANRAFGSDSDEVIRMSTGFVDGHIYNDVLTVAKHFPGHGRTTTDSHKTIPIVDISKEEFLANEAVPFQNLSESRLPAIMTGHLLFPNIDDQPASISKVWQTDILRTEMGFKGLIISDDMNMGAVKNDPARFKEAILAGTNMLIYVQYLSAQEEAMSDLIQEAEVNEELSAKIDASVHLILATKCQYKILDECK